MLIEAVNFHENIAITEDGRTLVIEDWFDDEGDICDSEMAVACIATDGDVWYVIELDDFDYVGVH